MASITVRNLDPAVKEALRLRAAANGRSMEEEARTYLAELASTGGLPSPGAPLAPQTNSGTGIRQTLLGKRILLIICG